MNKIAMMDRFYFPETARSYTKEGYLIVPATIARPGIQMYRAKELVDEISQLPPNIKPDDPITVYRPPEEVFNEVAVDSFKNVAVTNNHPPAFLNSKNHREFSVGIVLSDVCTEDKFVKGTLKITDEATINDINEGKVEVSAGYYSTIIFEDGILEDGTKYQATQRNIEGNHVAVVARGRAGSDVKLADGLDQPSERSETLVEEGISRQEGSEASETMFSKEGERGGSEEEEFGADGVPGSNMSSPFSDKKSTDECKDSDVKNKNKEELAMQLQDALNEIEDLKKANESLSKQIVDQASLDAMVEDRMMLIDACSKMVEDMDYIGKSNSQIKREVLSAKMPDMKLEDASEEYVNAAFDVMSRTINDNVSGEHDSDVYGEDLEFKDGEGDPESAEKPSEGESVKETTANTKEGVNEAGNEAEAESDETDEDKTENMDSASVLDEAFAVETNVKLKDKKTDGMTAYERYCERSRNSWKD